MGENGSGPLRSATITGLATARAMLRPLGFTRDRLARPNIGVAHMWSETGPCNFSHRTVAQLVKDGIEAAGGTAFEFATVSSTTASPWAPRHEGLADQPRADHRLDRKVAGVVSNQKKADRLSRKRAFLQPSSLPRRQARRTRPEPVSEINVAQPALSQGSATVEAWAICSATPASPPPTSSPTCRSTPSPRPAATGCSPRGPAAPAPTGPPSRAAGSAATRRHPGRLETRSPWPVAAPPGRHRHGPRRGRRRVPEPAGGDRHHHPRRQAGLPRVRRPGRVRTRSHSGTDQRRAGGRPRPRPPRRTTFSADRSQAPGGAGDVCVRAVHGRGDRQDPRREPRLDLPPPHPHEQLINRRGVGPAMWTERVQPTTHRSLRSPCWPSSSGRGVGGSETARGWP